MCCRLFFITSLLIEAFCGSFEEVRSEEHQIRKRAEMRSVVAVSSIWSRHSYHSVAVHGQTRNIEGTKQYLEYSQQGLCLDAFTDLIVTDAFQTTQNKFDTWGASMHRALNKAVKQLEAAAPIEDGSLYHKAANVLLDLCAEASHYGAYSRLHELTQTAEQPIAARRQQQVMSMQVAPSAYRECTYKQICWARGHSPTDSELEEALAVLPELKGLCEPSSSSVSPEELGVYWETCRLLRLMQLHKWSISRTFSFMDGNSDGTHQLHEFEQVCRLRATMDKLASSKLLRLEAYRVAVDRQMKTLQVAGKGVDAEAVEIEHQCLQHAELIGKELLFDRHIQEVLLICILSSICVLSQFHFSCH